MVRKRAFWIALLLFTAVLCSAQRKSDRSLTVVFKDGHQKSFAMSDVSSIEFKNDTMLVKSGGAQESIPVANIVRMDFADGSKLKAAGPKHFIGKWEFGQGNGDNFYVTLMPDGQARKSIGASHGTWVVVDGEARISWDDGWRDVIREVNGKHEKFAYEPGKSITDSPSNVTNARSVNPEPL